MKRCLKNNLNPQGDTPLTIDNFKDVFHFYKVTKFIWEKLKDFPAGFKLNIGFSLSIGNLYERKNNVYQKIITAKQILNKADVFHHIDEVFYDFSKVFESHIQ